jgi:hypothetical protein
MVNWVIVGAVVIQFVAGRISRFLGAILGFLITTGILLWGVMVYGAGGQIAFATFPLPFSIFILACLVWYVFDVRELLAAFRGRRARRARDEQAAESDWE